MMGIMWCMPDCSAFNVEDHGIIRGIGKLQWSWLSKLKQASNALLTRARQPAHIQATSLINQLTTTLEDFLYRLEHISTNFRIMQLGVHATQRVFLELLACLDYIEIYRPAMVGDISSTSVFPEFSNADRIGTFTTDLTVCNQMHRANIPVWLIRPYRALHSIRIMSIAPVQMPGGIVDLEPAIKPSYPTIFTGGNSMDKYCVLVRHVLGYFVYPDPFGSMCALPSISPPPAQSGPSKREICLKQYTPCMSSYALLIHGSRWLTFLFIPKMQIARRIL
jgi:hypothetical protein